MDTGKFIGLLVFFLVGALVLVAFVPIIQETTEPNATIVNDGAYYVELDPTDSYTIEYDSVESPDTVYINGEALTVNGQYTIAAFDKSILRYTSENHTFQYKGDNHYIVNIDMLNITIASGEVSGTYTTTTVTTETEWPETTFDKVYVASVEKQDLVMSEYNHSVKMLGDSEIFAMGQTLLSNNSFALIRIYGTIDDGVTIEVLNVNTGEIVDTATVSNVSINATNNPNYIGVYDLVSITFEVTLSGSTTNCTYSAYIVPSELVAEKSVHPDTTLSTIFNLLPLIAGVGLLMFLVAEFLYTRYL